MISFAFATSGQSLTLTVFDGQNKISKTALIVEEAINRATTEDEIKKQFNRLKETPFMVNAWKIDLPSHCFIPIKKLNEMRREIIKELIEKRSYHV